MPYSHAERTLATIQRLEAETAELLGRQGQLDAEEEQWLRETAGQPSWNIRASDAVSFACPLPPLAWWPG
jgi:hypothetical protein